MRKLVLLPFLVFITVLKLNAQRVEFGMGVGPTWYKGDLQPTFRPLNPDIAANIFGRYNATRVFSFKINGMGGYIRGNDSKSGNVLNKARGLYFRDLIVDYNVQAEYNFMNFRTHNGRYEKFWTPYLFGGIGQNYKLVITNGSNTVGGTPSKGTISSSSPNSVLFYGIGYKKRLKSQWNFGIELGSRGFFKQVYGENLDNFSQITKTTANNLFQIPNTPQKDKYLYLNFSMSYLFYKVHCP